MTRAQFCVVSLACIVGCGPSASTSDGETSATGGESDTSGESDTGGEPLCASPMVWGSEDLVVESSRVGARVVGGDGLFAVEEEEEEGPMRVYERGPDDWQAAGVLQPVPHDYWANGWKTSMGRVLVAYAYIEDLAGENTGPPADYFVYERGPDDGWSVVPVSAGDVEFGVVGGKIYNDRIALPGADHTGTVGLFARAGEGQWELEELLELDGDVARISLEGDHLLVTLTDRYELFEHDGVAWQGRGLLEVDEGLPILAEGGARYYVQRGEQLDIHELEGERALVQSLEAASDADGAPPLPGWRWTPDWIIYNLPGDFSDPVDITVYHREQDGTWSLHLEAVIDNKDYAVVGDELLMPDNGVVRRYSLCD